MLYQISDGTVSAGGEVILSHIDFEVRGAEKIAVVGKNGAGKTTLLRLIAGEMDLDRDDRRQGPGIVRARQATIGMLRQQAFSGDDRTVEEEILSGCPEQDPFSRERFEYQREYEALFTGFGFRKEDRLKRLSRFSGGERTKIALIRLLLDKPDILLLDEPTNDLDIQTLTILEDYLDSFQGIVIAVSHDRYFLDRVTNKILELSHGKIYTYEAKYSQFLEMKAEREEMELASERKRQSILRMELEWAKRGCRARTTKQRARLDRLETLKNGAAPVRDKNVEIDSVETRMGKKTIELHHISKSFGDKVCIRDFDYIVLKNQRLGIIGPNGCGKSTLLKIIAGIIQPDSGAVEIGETVKIGYFSQEIEEMNTSQRVIDYIKDVAEYIPTKDGLISATKLLEQFLFDSSMQYAPIEKLSGGEKKRLYLLKVLAAAPNVLLLDEITNDIDIPTLTILEDYLDSFAGIVIAVSHDRYFLDNIADRIFEFDRRGNLTQYEGGYTDYLEAKKRRFGDSIDSDSGKRSEGSREVSDSGEKDSAKTWKQNRPTKLKFSYKEQREYDTIDEDIAKLEAKIEKLDQDIMANATNSGKLNELTKEKEEAEALLEEKMDR